MGMIAGCRHLGQVVLGIGMDAMTFATTILRSRAALAAENLFRRK